MPQNNQEKVETMHITRQPGWLYYLRGRDVWRSPMKRAGGPSAKGQAEKVFTGRFTREAGYLYFLDSAGDVARSPLGKKAKN